MNQREDKVTCPRSPNQLNADGFSNRPAGSQRLLFPHHSTVSTGSYLQFLAGFASAAAAAASPPPVPPPPALAPKFFSSKSQGNWVAEYLILSHFGNTCFQKEIWCFCLNSQSSRTRVFPNKGNVQKLFAVLAVSTHSLWMQLHFPSSVFSKDSDGIKMFLKGVA